MIGAKTDHRPIANFLREEVKQRDLLTFRPFVFSFVPRFGRDHRSLLHSPPPLLITSVRAASVARVRLPFFSLTVLPFPFSGKPRNRSWIEETAWDAAAAALQKDCCLDLRMAR